VWAVCWSRGGPWTSQAAKRCPWGTLWSFTIYCERLIQARLGCGRGGAWGGPGPSSAPPQLEPDRAGSRHACSSVPLLACPRKAGDATSRHFLGRFRIADLKFRSLRAKARLRLHSLLWATPRITRPLPLPISRHQWAIGLDTANPGSSGPARRNPLDLPSPPLRFIVLACTRTPPPRRSRPWMDGYGAASPAAPWRARMTSRVVFACSA
jgi:hypothetical protein